MLFRGNLDLARLIGLDVDAPSRWFCREPSPLIPLPHTLRTSFCVKFERTHERRSESGAGSATPGWLSARNVMRRCHSTQNRPASQVVSSPQEHSHNRCAFPPLLLRCHKPLLACSHFSFSVAPFVVFERCFRGHHRQWLRHLSQGKLGRATPMPRERSPHGIYRL